MARSTALEVLAGWVGALDWVLRRRGGGASGCSGEVVVLELGIRFNEMNAAVRP